MTRDTRPLITTTDAQREQKRQPITRDTTHAKGPYGLQLIENCLVCPFTKDSIFCDLSRHALEGLDAISSSTMYPKGAILFVEGQESRGVFIICHGRVKLSAGSAGGRALILRMGEAGEIVGLPSTISGRPYEATAEALEPIQANFIPRDLFMNFLQAHAEAAVRVAELLSGIYHATCQEIRNVGLSASAAEKLARFLLSALPAHNNTNSENGSVRVAFTLTHEEIAETIGSSRETVTRLFSRFKRDHLIEVHGATLIVKNRAGLQTIVDSPALHPARENRLAKSTARSASNGNGNSPKN
jgi:CRP/FNR family transcriptional regulator, cyclic AMP receptor protein